MLSLILCIAGFVVGGIVFVFVGTTYRKKVAEKEIGSAEEEAAVLDGRRLADAAQDFPASASQIQRPFPSPQQYFARNSGSVSSVSSFQ